MIFRPHLLPILALILTLLTSFTLAEQAASFCKCTCFTNSTIVRLGPRTSQANLLLLRDIQSDSVEGELDSRATAPDQDGNRAKVWSCSDCTRQFCLDQHLSICKGATIEQVFTTCFQRDSARDEAVVILFMIITSGLLLYAVLKPYMDKRMEPSQNTDYAPLQTGRDTE